MIIKPPGLPTLALNSYKRVLITTKNEGDPEDANRRFRLIRCSDRYVGDSAYLCRLYGLIDDRNALHTFWEHFKPCHCERILIRYHITQQWFYACTDRSTIVSRSRHGGDDFIRTTCPGVLHTLSRGRHKVDTHVFFSEHRGCVDVSTFSQV